MMKVTIASKNFNTTQHLKDTIDRKFEKLGKYFSDDIVVNVMVSAEKERETMEATINARGMIFRAESTSDDIYECVDKVVDRLSTQMSRFKSKIQKKYKDNKALNFMDIPDEEDAEIRVVRTKKFELVPMNVEEAIVNMELLQHNFYVFLNMETDSVNVVYKRKSNDYGLLETTF